MACLEIFHLLFLSPVEVIFLIVSTVLAMLAVLVVYTRDVVWMFGFEELLVPMRVLKCSSTLVNVWLCWV